MDKYEQISVVGEGSYGLVMKCRHKETDQLVAIKKFLETEEDATIRKMALREIRMLKKLKHENLVTMIEVFRHRKRFYLVFEYLEGTVLDELEKIPGGLGEERTRERIFQVVRAINYCHSNHIIHRDVKPENVLVSSLGVVKLCDFGFARIISVGGEPCTEYVATRWYRAPELLVGEANYGPAVDIWAVGCLFAEMMTGDPIFPGESDIDQLYLIVKLLGKPCCRHQQLMSKSSQLRGMVKSASEDSDLFRRFPTWPPFSLDFLTNCMKMDPQERSTSDDLLKDNYFTHDRFPQRFLPCLREKVNTEFNSNPLLRKYKTEILMSTDKRDELRHTRKVAHQNEPIRWKFGMMTEGGSMKRKLSNDYNNDNGDKNLITLSKTSQRLNNVMVPKPNQKTQKSKNTIEMEMLEKSLESFARFKGDDRPNSSIHKTESNRGGEGCNEGGENSSPILPPSPPQFQSLQQNFLDLDRSPNILHPTINNISFNRDPPKKSPNFIQTITSFNGTVKTSQVPLLANSTRTLFLKKLERNIVVDNMFEAGNLNNGNGGGTTTTTWLNSFSTNLHNKNVSKKQEQKVRNDVFTLPNLPGATGSPGNNNNRNHINNLNNKKKSLPEPDLLHSTNVTPRIQSSTSQKHSPTTLTTLTTTTTTNKNNNSTFPLM